MQRIAHWTTIEVIHTKFLRNDVTTANMPTDVISKDSTQFLEIPWLCSTTLAGYNFTTDKDTDILH